MPLLALILSSYECEPPSTEAEKSHFALTGPHPPEVEGELTDSFQSLPLPSTSSGSTSGVHEDESVGISPTEIYKILGFNSSTQDNLKDLFPTATTNNGVAVIGTQMDANDEGKPQLPL